MFKDLDKKMNAKDKDLLMEIDELWDLIDEDEWVVNPGGIPAVVLSKMPRFIRIPADSSAFEIEDVKKGVLGKTLSELFEEVRDSSVNYKNAQEALNKLSDEMNPSDGSSKFGEMMNDLNSVLSSVFPESKIHAKADLSDPDKVLLPAFAIQLSSNIKTPVSHQGTGMVRAAVFGMLRYRQKWITERDGQSSRSLIIGFEEPEIYLHPSASNQMRDTIYELSSKASQIIATTHSPYMIDLSRNPRQVLNKFSSTIAGTQCLSFNVSDEFLKLSFDDQSYVKMILKMDDYVARCFFTKKVVIVEGDTEDVVFREAIKALPDADRLKIRASFEVIKARGKATIIGLCKYFNSLGVEYCVIHDRDAGVAGAEKFNAPIKAAAGGHTVHVLGECIEDVLGYPAPESEKPLTAYEFTKSWNGEWGKVPDDLKTLMRAVFDGCITV